MTQFEPTLRAVVHLCALARQDVERSLSTYLPNVEHYAVLARVDALSADVTRVVADALANALTE